MIRPFDPNRDRQASHRIWRECGWLDKDEKEAIMDRFVDCGRAVVGELNGEAECLVLTAPGFVRYLDEDLPFSGVTGVTTSLVARKQGLAGRATAQSIAQDALDGALVCGLSPFEQGYYNQLGFGMGGYNHRISFDPAQLDVSVRARPPQRLTKDNLDQLHAARLKRIRGHAGINFTPPPVTLAELDYCDGFGFGYFDGPNGELTHALTVHAKNLERDPFRIQLFIYQNREQFLELMALVKSFEEQVRLVTIGEPPGIQLQDLVRQPQKHRQITAKTEYDSRIVASAHWQMRILDLPGCMAQTHLPVRESVRFNLRVSDPISRYIEDGQWRGVTGEYIVTLGQESNAAPGQDSRLPILDCTVNAFTRLWLGVRPATGLAFTDQLVGPPELLRRLDAALCLPTANPDWEF